MKLEQMEGLRRTHTCGELRTTDVGREVVVMGWVRKRRNLGGLLFVDLYDRHGITQVVFRPDDDPTLHAKAVELGLEHVIGVRGLVSARPEGTDAETQGNRATRAAAGGGGGASAAG